MAAYLPAMAIALTWYQHWETFINNDDAGMRFPRYASMSSGGFVELPGAIDNSALMMQVDGHMYLRRNAKYVTVMRETWKFFHEKYGGGPEVCVCVCS